MSALTNIKLNGSEMKNMEQSVIIFENNGMRKEFFIFYLAAGIVMVLMSIVDFMMLEVPISYYMGGLALLLSLPLFYLAFLEYAAKNDYVEFTLKSVKIRSTPQLGTGFSVFNKELSYPAIKSVNVVGIRSIFSNKTTIALQISYEEENGLIKERIILDRFPGDLVLKIGQLLEVSANVGNKVKQFADQHPELVSKAKVFLTEATNFLKKLSEPIDKEENSIINKTDEDNDDDEEVDVKID